MIEGRPRPFIPGVQILTTDGAERQAAQTVERVDPQGLYPAPVCIGPSGDAGGGPIHINPGGTHTFNRHPYQQQEGLGDWLERITFQTDSGDDLRVEQIGWNGDRLNPVTAGVPMRVFLGAKGVEVLDPRTTDVHSRLKLEVHNASAKCQHQFLVWMHFFDIEGLWALAKKRDLVVTESRLDLDRSWRAAPLDLGPGQTGRLHLTNDSAFLQINKRDFHERLVVQNVASLLRGLQLESSLVGREIDMGRVWVNGALIPARLRSSGTWPHRGYGFDQPLLLPADAIVELEVRNRSLHETTVHVRVGSENLVRPLDGVWDDEDGETYTEMLYRYSGYQDKRGLVEAIRARIQP